MIVLVHKHGTPVKLSAHVAESEMACQCSYPECRSTIHSTKLLELFEKFRESCGNVPLKISSGYRCARHNWQEEGVALSYHQVGCALDIMCPEHLTLDQFATKAEEIFPFVKRYHNRVHVDTRGA